ncbi:hypothetical protein AaE_005210 [Aphanomyces astaci]|uniref:Uncharacterized protein n=1 Tax=Aphanomyces astaci TaxID=112090 RepID=A0A6A5AJQ9_APHAT|nr:hypothetical protein AaE_005210 [Aphanomyces astaci]
MSKPPDVDLVVTKKALREHKLVVYKEPSAKVKLRQSTLPMYAAATSNNAMNTVQQTPPRKRTFKQQPPPLVSNSPTRDNELSAELAGLLHACDVEEENSPRSSFTKHYTSIDETFRSMHAPGSPAGSNAEPAAKKYRVTRRGTSIPEYKEISLSRKMRQGDRYSFHTYFK